MSETHDALPRLKTGLAEMLKGGVIMDVTNAEQAKIAEDSGACAVMALERVPSDIRKQGGVARMSMISVIEKIMETVSVPVMAKVRIGHFAEAIILQELGVEHVILCGVVTSVCIDSTGRAANELGYKVTVLSDCIAGRSATEQDFYCEDVFPLYAEVCESDALRRDVTA